MEAKDARGDGRGIASTRWIYCIWDVGAHLEDGKEPREAKAAPRWQQRNWNLSPTTARNEMPPTWTRRGFSQKPLWFSRAHVLVIWALCHLKKPSEPTWTSDPQNLEITCWCCFKLPGRWQFVNSSNKKLIQHPRHQCRIINSLGQQVYASSSPDPTSNLILKGTDSV